MTRDWRFTTQKLKGPFRLLPRPFEPTQQLELWMAYPDNFDPNFPTLPLKSRVGEDPATDTVEFVLRYDGTWTKVPGGNLLDE